jgi:YVTN family beta-propeller protein
MKKINFSVLIAFFAATICRADGLYHFIKEIPVGGDGGWDYLTVDSAAKRLYVSHATKVVVIDLTKDAVIGEITNTPGVHGIVIDAKSGRGFVSNGRSNSVSIVDLKTFQTLSQVGTEKNPDAILFEPSQNEVYTFNGRSHSATVINADSGKVVTTIPLGGKPEFACLDPVAGRIYNNLEDKNEVAVIDIKTHTVITNWPIAPGESASGMAIDLKNHRLFLGCDNDLMVMIDSTTGNVIAHVPIGGGVDANAFDPGSQLAFASCGESGTTTIAKEDGDKLTVIQTLTTAPGARTMALDETTHRIYLATASYGSSTSQAAGKRPPMVSGSFKILVYGTEK